LFKNRTKLINVIVALFLIVIIASIVFFVSKIADNSKILIPLYIIAFIFIVFVLGVLSFGSSIYLQILEARKDIHSVVAPKFLNISIETNDLIELAVEIWRLESRLNKSLHSSSESQKEMIHNSIKKIKRYLDKNDIEIMDYTNQKFNDGRNLDILSIETDPKISHSIIKETKEPTIMLKGQVVRKGKVIVLAKNTDGVEGVKNE